MLTMLVQGSFGQRAKVVFAPANADAVGVYDVSTETFSTVTTGALTMDYKFWGAAAVEYEATCAKLACQPGPVDVSLSHPVRHTRFRWGIAKP